MTKRNYLSVSTTIDQSLSATFGNLGSSCTVFTATPGGIIKRTGVTINGAYRLTYAGNAFIGEIVVARATTPYEDDIIRRLLGHYLPVPAELPTDYWLVAMRGIYAANGGNAVGGAWLPKHGGMFSNYEMTANAVVGGTVAILQDLSKGLVLGANPIAADLGAFTLDGNWTRSGGIVSCAGGISYIHHGYNHTPGMLYEFKFTISNYVSGSCGIVGAYYGVNQLVSGDGNYTLYIIPSATRTALYFYGNAFFGSVSNMSMREVTGAHAVQLTVANRLTYLQTPTTGIPCLNSPAAANVLQATLPDLGSACTVARMRADGLEVLTGQTIGAGAYTVNPPLEVMFGKIVVSRALTALELHIVAKLLATCQPALGPELIVAGGWQPAANWTIVGDVLTHTPGSATIISSTMTTAPAVNNIYNIKYTIQGLTAGTLIARCGASSSAAVATNGAYSNTLVPTATTSTRMVPSSPFDGVVSGVSTKKVL
jgi:hypothetical protein